MHSASVSFSRSVVSCKLLCDWPMGEFESTCELQDMSSGESRCVTGAGSLSEVDENAVPRCGGKHLFFFCVAVHGLSVCQKKFAYATPFTRCSLSSPCSLPHLDENRGTGEPNFCFCLTFLETGKTETDIVRNVDISTSTARLTEDFSFFDLVKTFAAQAW